MRRGVVVLLTLLTTSSFLFLSSFRFPTSSFFPYTSSFTGTSTRSLAYLLTPVTLSVVALLSSRWRRRRQCLRSTITVDGPAASGKGAVARLLAERLGYKYIDTGSLYRAVARLSALHGSEAPAVLAAKLRLHKSEISYLGNIVPDGDLRSEQVARRASEIGRDSAVRAAIRKLVRSEISRHPCVIEGRDCGSVLAPEADRKFLLTADVVERARRRAVQEFPTSSFESVLTDIIRRDANDQRHFAALRSDVHSIDCTSLSVTDTLNLILTLV